MVNQSKLRIALIGLGSIAQKAYLPILANHTKVSPILCTRNVQTLQQLSLQYRIAETYSDLDDLIQTQPDAAMVHSSTDSHVPILSKLLNANIPVFVDKPLSYSLKASESILELATKKSLPIFLGFNRRYAPLIRSLKDHPNPIQVSWQKNRVNLPDDPRVFIFDDFIHVVDSLRFLGVETVRDLNVNARISNKKLESIQVHWQQGATLLTGGMNRVSGITEETIEYYTPGNKWMINELNSGTHFYNGESSVLKFNNWETTLHKRGFVHMIDDWIDIAQKRHLNPATIKDIWETHQLCESILDATL